MKKIITTSLFILLCFSFQNYQADASEKILLLEENDFQITSDAFINYENDISLIKNSNLSIVHTYPTLDLENIEPTFKIEIFHNSSQEKVYELKTPSFEDLTDGQDAELLFVEYEDYFNSTSIYEDRIELHIPLNFEEGEYFLSLEIDLGDETFEKVEYVFKIFSSNYVFSNSQLTVEDQELLFTAQYNSFGGREQNMNTTILILDKNNTEVFKKDGKVSAYESGIVSVFEKIPKLNGDFTVKIEIFDEDGSTLFLYSELKSIEGDSNVLLTLIMFLFVIIFILFLFKNIKNKKIPTVVFIFFFSFLSYNLYVSAQGTSVCGPKPDDVCLVDEMSTHLCVTTDDCSIPDYGNKFFSTGKSLNIPSERRWVGPVSVNINVCQQISGLSNGNNFYVISDAVNSDWITKRYSIFEFTKGTPRDIIFDPGGKKRNVNSAFYDGNCTVKVEGKYSGKSSNFKMAQTTVVEAGKVTDDMCKSAGINWNEYRTNGSLLALSDCVISSCTPKSNWVPIITDQLCELTTCNDDYVQGDTQCINGILYAWTCTQAGWQQVEIGMCDGGSGSYCQASTSGTTPNTPVTFTAYPSSASYEWLDTNEDTNPMTRSITQTFSSTGVHSMRVLINGIEQTCSVTIDMPTGIPPNTQDPNNSTPNNSNSLFRFNPDIARQSDNTCRFETELTQQELISCTFTNRTVSYSGDPLVDGIGIKPGLWTLKCGTEEVTRQCRSNPFFNEE